MKVSDKISVVCTLGTLCMIRNLTPFFYDWLLTAFKPYLSLVTMVPLKASWYESPGALSSLVLEVQTMYKKPEPGSIPKSTKQTNQQTPPPLPHPKPSHFRLAWKLPAFCRKTHISKKPLNTLLVHAWHPESWLPNKILPTGSILLLWSVYQTLLALIKLMEGC